MRSSPACPRPRPRQPCSPARWLLAGLRPGGTWIEMSTQRPGRDRALRGPRRRARRRHAGGPVTGGVHRAAAGEITVLVGGDEALFETHRPALQAMGGEIIHMGPLGSGRGDQGHHQHAGLHPSRRRGRGADAGQARRARPRQGLRRDPRQLRQQLRPRDREPADPQRQLRHRLHHGPRLQGPGLRHRHGPRARRAAGAGRPGRADLHPRPAAAGGGAWSTEVVKLLEDALGEPLRADGFPPRLGPA